MAITATASPTPTSVRDDDPSGVVSAQRQGVLATGHEGEHAEEQDSGERLPLRAAVHFRLPAASYWFSRTLHSGYQFKAKQRRHRRARPELLDSVRRWLLLRQVPAHTLQTPVPLHGL